VCVLVCVFVSVCASMYVVVVGYDEWEDGENAIWICDECSAVINEA
jgi:hypothetical protein